tara:strand:- start:42845 stop:43048 length:204 start_codon:yes stop_codon:yes gene_type:complete
MEVFGFICLTLLLVAFTCGWFFMLIFDGAFGGKREIPVYVMVVILALAIWGWLGLVGMSPFTITIVT